MSRLDTVYATLPVFAQHSAISAYGLYWRRLRFGPGYREAVRAFSEREQFTARQWHDWQRQHLGNLLTMAASSVPYYQQTWNASEHKAALAGALGDLPLLDKAPLRAAPRHFVRTDLPPRRELVFHTSGSTGTPIATIWTVAELRASMALREVRSARWAGVSFEMPRATFSGRIVEPDPASSGPFYRYNLAEQQVYLSAFHLRPGAAPQYVAALRHHGTQWLTGYAVSYYLLARFILEQRLRVPPLRALITTSEKVTDEMRQVMQAAYGCRVYEEYSTVENVLFASECAHGRLHVSPDVAVVEILRPDGSPCEPGEVGEVVATCMMRSYQPLIRYRLGDLAAWDAEPCPCGRVMPVIKEVVGRVEDVVVGPDGRRLVRFHGIFVNQPHIREGQIIQERVDRIKVRIVPAQGFNQDDELDIIARVRQRMGAQIEVVVETVDCIPRTKAGKFQAVVSLVSK